MRQISAGAWNMGWRCGSDDLILARCAEPLGVHTWVPDGNLHPGCAVLGIGTWVQNPFGNELSLS